MTQLIHIAPIAIWAAYATALGFNMVTLHTQRLIWRRRGTVLATVAWASHFAWLWSYLSLPTSGIRHFQASEVAFVTGWLIVGLSLGLFALWRETSLLIAPMTLGLVLMWVGLLLPAASVPLPESLSTLWLPLHVGTSLLAYASFAAAAAASSLWLLQRAALKSPGLLGWALRLPSLHTIETFVTTCVLGGLPLIGLSIVTGTGWALQYSGDLIGWLPKVASTVAVATTYIAYLVLDRLSGTAEYRPVAAIAGLITALISLVGLPVVGPGLHDFVFR